MDGNAIEDHVTDYVDGKCDADIQHEIDKKRQQDPDFDTWVRTHETLLSVLKTTAIAAAPNGLGERILSAIRQKEERIAEEQKRYHREMIMLIPMAVFAGAFFHVLNNWLMDGITTVAYRIIGWFNSIIGIPSVPTQIAGWLGTTGRILGHPLPLPFLSASIPAYIIAAAAMLIGVVWYYHDDPVQIG
ncbi:MAG: hypothetical protein V3S89_12690 [Desulfobacterales bacterium]